MNATIKENIETPPFKFRTADGIGYLTLDRAATYNAFDHSMVVAFETLLRELRYDEETRVVILDGGDAKGFCAGLDTKIYAF